LALRLHQRTPAIGAAIDDARIAGIVHCNIFVPGPAMSQPNLKSVKDIYAIGEIPPQFHVPEKM